MKTSQKLLLGAFVLVLMLVAGAVIGGVFMLERATSGAYSGEAPERSSISVSGTSADLDLRGFTGIDARGVWQIELVNGEDFAVHLTYPEDAADRLDVRVSDNRLVLGYDGSRGFRLFGGPDERFTARIVMPRLDSVETSGASKLTLSGFSGGALRVVASGASELKANDSNYDSLTLIVSGAGDIDMRDMPVVDAQVVLSGAGGVELYMNGGALTGTVSGAGKVRYHGSVRTQQIVASGFSSVEHID